MGRPSILNIAISVKSGKHAFAMPKTKSVGILRNEVINLTVSWNYYYYYYYYYY